MYEYTICNEKTGEERIVFGLSWEDACRRYKLEGFWDIILYEYID